MRVAITGASGFVGRHVVAAFLAQGSEVIAAVRTSQRPWIDSDKLTIVELDIGNPEEAAALLRGPDVLIHLAWSGLPNYRSDSHLKEELPKQIAFLDACKLAGLKRLVVTGTCLEYGMQSGVLHEDLPAAPVTAYAQAKHRLHEHLQLSTEAGGPTLAWLRLFYLYGSGQAPTSLYSQLQSAVLSGAAHFPLSPGDQLRDFLPIEIAGEVIRKLALNINAVGTVNICSGRPIAVATLVRRWLRDWGSAMELNIGTYPYPDYEPFEFWGSAKKLNSLLEAT